MTPPARLSAAIEILDIYLGGQAIEKALTNWARRSRFAGSKDRAAIRDIVFDCLRCRKSFAARGNGETGRGLVCAHAAADRNLDEMAALFSGEGHAPAPLSAEEVASLFQTQALQNWEVEFDLPEWLSGEFSASLGPDDATVASVLRQRAPVFVRVNLTKTTRDQAAASLAKDGIVAIDAERAKTALEVVENPRKLAGSDAFKLGLIELQDASSQAICAGLPTAKRMLDYCAGGGGKVLAYGDLNTAQLYAHDANAGRLKDLAPRAARAGLDVSILDKQACRAQAPFDLVLCDVPCSGSGTWRRAPEGKWSLTPQALSRLHEIQVEILKEAATLVSDGGCLSYVTCSVLKSENSQQIQRFLDLHPEFQLTSEMQFLPDRDGDGLYAAHLTHRGVPA